MSAGRLAIGVVILISLIGCGGPDLGGSTNNSAFSNNLSGNYSGYNGASNGGGFGGAGGISSGRPGQAAHGRGTYARLESSFELPNLQGDPFDYTENDVLVTFITPDGRTVRVPAFFDGGKTWRVRYTPDTSGRHNITTITLNGKPIQPDKFDKRDFDVSGKTDPGFVRRDTQDRSRFVFDNGNSYYPIGHNVAWGSGKPGDIEGLLAKMGEAGENWSRIWMTNQDGKNLDWSSEKSKTPFGTLNLDAAKRWDAIVDAAEKDGIYFQIVLQHHGQYSTRVDSIWDSNPWNKKNGGWLSTPDEFFSNSRAIALTKAKYRYILARWGYSPHVMAWELFNEAEYTDAATHQHADEVSTWHNGMATFLRQQDPYKHLITSSSGINTTLLGTNLDYYQPHAYLSDPVGAVADLDVRKLDRPVFIGEIGPDEGLNKDDGSFLHRALWSGLMSEASGAPEYWAWETVEKNDLYSHFRSASAFITQSGLLSRHGLLPASVGVETSERGTLSFAPGAGWAAAKQTEYTILPSGEVEGLSAMPAFIQGNAHRALFPGATFKATFTEPGTFAMTIGQVSRAGAKLTLSVDGTVAASKDFPATNADSNVDATLSAKIPIGAHTIQIANTGADWAAIKRVTLTSYAPALGIVGKAGKDFTALWLYRRPDSAGGVTPGTGLVGKVLLSGLKAGSYKATWWSTQEGKTLSEDEVTVAKSGPLTLTTPAITNDIAVYLTKLSERPAAKSGKKQKN